MMCLVIASGLPRSLSLSIPSLEAIDLRTALALIVARYLSFCKAPTCNRSSVDLMGYPMLLHLSLSQEQARARSLSSLTKADKIFQSLLSCQNLHFCHKVVSRTYVWGR